MELVTQILYSESLYSKFIGTIFLYFLGFLGLADAEKNQSFNKNQTSNLHMEQWSMVMEQWLLSNGLVFKALNSQSRGPRFKTIRWLQDDKE